jgi:DNA-binding IclR family transcriptional regulator
VLRRGLAVLDCFADGQTEQTVAELVRRTGFPPATVHRLLAVLVDWGGVERIGHGRYRLGLRMWQLGAQVPGARTLRDLALPYLEDLYETTRGVVHLAVVDGLDALYVEKISGRLSVAVTSRVGRRMPLYATGPGKVLLANAGPELLEAVLAAGLTALTPKTIIEEAELRRALAQIRREGFAVSREETSLGTASVAAPVVDGLGDVVAAIAVVTRADSLDVRALATVTVTVARAISRDLLQTGAV